MCLQVNKKETKKYRQKNKNKKWVVVWKILKKEAPDNKYVTPYVNKSINCGWFKPTGTIVTGYNDTLAMLNKDFLYGGVIHAWTARKHARMMIKLKKELLKRLQYLRMYKLVRCKALMKDFVAVGYNGDICFTKIWIPANFEKQQN